MACMTTNCKFSKLTGTCSVQGCTENAAYIDERVRPGKRDSARSDMEALVAAGKAPGGQNPKEAFGDKKPPIDYIPLSALLAMNAALLDGALKYGWYNWRVNKIEALTYLNAGQRHMKLWGVGEELTRDTKVKNLGAVMACCAILIDAEVHGTLIDNRHKSDVEANLLHEAEAWVANLKEAQKQREKAKNGSNPH